MKKVSFANYPGIPQHTRGALERYLVNGYMPGGFLTAVFTNDLFSAVSRADHWNQQALPDIVKFIYNEAPMGARGSVEKMEDYCRARLAEWAEHDAKQGI